MLAPPISGYILAGGRSSRMGSDKALLQLAGKPLVAHAVARLRRVCADVHILSETPGLAVYAPLVPDVHANCGPVGGIEAALAHSTRDWNLILPVDVPFLPVALLEGLVGEVVACAGTARVVMFALDAGPQPAVCLLHKDIAPSIAAAIVLEELRLLPVLEAAANIYALQHGHPLDQVFRLRHIADSQSVAFANLNTAQDFADAEANSGALDS